MSGLRKRRVGFDGQGRASEVDLHAILDEVSEFKAATERALAAAAASTPTASTTTRVVQVGDGGGGGAPSSMMHNATGGKQGGLLPDEYYHLPASHYGDLTDADAQLADLHTDASPTFAGATFSGLTASELIATDGDKALQSLAVATYPSLTEIAYVKGVTSAIQTQINAKGGGDVVGPAASTDHAIARFDGATGKLLQDTANAILEDSGALKVATLELTTATTHQGIQFSGGVGTAGFRHYINVGTADGADDHLLTIMGGGGFSTRGAFVTWYGNEAVADSLGRLWFSAGNPGTAGTWDGHITFSTGGVVQMNLHDDGLLVLTGDLLVDGGNIGITANPDLIQFGATSVTVTESLLPGSASGSSLGSTDLEWANVYIGTGRAWFGAGQESSVYYDGTGLLLHGHLRVTYPSAGVVTFTVV